ncbi:phage tail tape measure protein [Klebsiella pneumoniae]|uniref:phage tail tape measure protein n=2 Tax=Klebsiella/Raoultella group TaxID=2890311 RepID=UPI003967E3F9
MLPLFDNNNEKLKQFLQLSKDFGVAPPQEDIDNLVKVNQFFQDIETSARGLKMEIASGLAKVDLSPLQDGLDSIHDVFTDPAILQGLSDLVGEAISLAGVVGRIAGGLGAIASYTRSRVGAVSGNYDSADEKDIEQRIEFLNKRGNQSKEQKDELDFLNKRLQFLRAIKSSLTPEEVEKGANGLTSLLSDMGIQPPKGDDYKLGKGESNQKVTTKSNPTENAFKSRLLDLQKQAALIETTGKKTAEVTELEKVNFDITSGNLKKLSEAQKNQLRDAAKFLDSKKEELRLNQENAKVAEYVSGLERQNKLIKQGYDSEFIGRYSGDRERSRMQERNSIQQEYEGSREDLLKQYQSGDISKSLYDAETEALQDALNKRLEIQNDYYKQQDELQNDYSAGLISGFATQATAAMDLYSTMQQVGAQTFSSMTDMIIAWAETGKLNAQDFAATFIQSVGAAMLQYAAAQVAMAALNAFTQWIGVPYVGPAVAPAQAIAAAAAAGVFMTAIGSALHGQAHDGIDSVPETGTWLLQKGERVTTAKTSAKLDATLDRVANQSTGGATYAPSMSFYVNGDPSDAQIAMMKKAASDGAQMGYQKAVQSIATGQGDLHRALMGKTTSGRKIS